MSDVLLRFLIMARRRDRGPLRRFFYVDEPWLSAGVEQLVETAAVRVSLTTQYEEVWRQQMTIAASHRHNVRFYEAPQPNPPRDTSEERTEDFALENTLEVKKCPSCSGRKTARCRSCSGSGRRVCRVCRGSGRLGQRRCSACGGRRRLRCSSCRGRGRKGCATCLEEGRVAVFEKEVYRWTVRRRSATQYPPNSHPDLVEAVDEWFETDTGGVADLKPRTAVGELGFETPQVLEVLARAEHDRLRLIAEAEPGAARQVLSSSTLCQLAPVGHSVVRRKGRAFSCWLVGRGESAREILPPRQPDLRKCFAWLGLGVMIPLELAGLSRLLDAWSHASRNGSFTDAVFVVLLAGVLAGGALTAGLVLRRNLRRPPAARAVGIAHQTGVPTSMLPCLAYLGSYTGRLSILDRTYETQTERLLGEARSESQSETLAVRMADGRKIFLIELARPHRLSDGQLSELIEALDGLVVLEDASATPADDENLFARLQKLARHQRAGQRFRIVKALIDRNADEDLRRVEVPDAGLPLEAIRSAFVGKIQGNVDWHRLFLSLWSVVERVLGPMSRSRTPEPG